MPIRKGEPIRFTPKGLSDAWDSTDTFPGACRILQNLIFDKSNPELVITRPGVGNPVSSFAGFNLPTFVSVYIVVGTVIYGMVSTSRTVGYDEPFAYDTMAGAFITISGVTSANVPTTLLTTGDWTPPTMTVVGTKVIVTHVGFSGIGSNFFGVIDISNPAAPAWSSHNLATNALPSVPTCVANFNNRAYYTCANVAVFSDSLDPLTRTNASQAVTIGDTTSIVALSGLPAQTTSGGVVQMLLIFKNAQIWQITGDPATTNLAVNYLSLNIGTYSPRSIAQTPMGSIFASFDGPYLVNQIGIVMPLVKNDRSSDQDIVAPFQNAQNKSRMSAVYSGSIYRVCMDTIVLGQAVTNDYWFDMNVRRWTGPHTFPYDCADQLGNMFVLSHRSLGAKLFMASTIPLQSSVYQDNGVDLTCFLESCSLPKKGDMSEKQIVESTIELSSNGQSIPYLINAIDDQRNILNTCTVNTYGTGNEWGDGSTYGGGAVWTSATKVPHVYNIPWTQPVVFQKFALQVMASGQSGIAIGTSYCRYQDCGYTNAG